MNVGDQAMKDAGARLLADEMERLVESTGEDTES